MSEPPIVTVEGFVSNHGWMTHRSQGSVLMFALPAPPSVRPILIVAVSETASVASAQIDPLIPAGTPVSGETVSPDEAAITQAILAGIAAHVRDTAKTDPALRDAHPKAHGCVKASFRVLDGLPDRLRIGLFAKPHDYQAWIRFSNGSPTPQADDVADARGMAIKVMGVEGSAATTQDFVMINGPAFFVRTVQDYISFTSEPPLRFFVPDWNPFHIRWREFLNVRTITQQNVLDPLAIRFWSETPYLFGATAFKFSARPSDPATAMEASASPDRLREAMVTHLATADAHFDFLMQLRDDPEANSIEDSAIEWSEAQAPFQPVAAITIPAQRFDSPEQRAFCDALSFTPWHGLPAHRPLGGINRMRRAIYKGIARLRHGLNKTPEHEPAGF